MLRAAARNELCALSVCGSTGTSRITERREFTPMPLLDKPPLRH